jgi:hypothetical protein
MALLAATMACGGGDRAPTAPAPLGLPGVFALATLNGQPLPYELINDGHTQLAWTADTIHIAANGTYSERRWIIFNETGSLTPFPTLFQGTVTQFGTNGAHLDSYNPSDHFDIFFSDSGLAVPAGFAARFYARCSRC